MGHLYPNTAEAFLNDMLDVDVGCRNSRRVLVPEGSEAAALEERASHFQLGQEVQATGNLANVLAGAPRIIPSVTVPFRAP